MVSKKMGQFADQIYCACLINVLVNIQEQSPARKQTIDSFIGTQHNKAAVRTSHLFACSQRNHTFIIHLAHSGLLLNKLTFSFHSATHSKVIVKLQIFPIRSSVM